MKNFIYYLLLIAMIFFCVWCLMETINKNIEQKYKDIQIISSQEHRNAIKYLGLKNGNVDIREVIDRMCTKLKYIESKVK